MMNNMLRIIMMITKDYRRRGNGEIKVVYVLVLIIKKHLSEFKNIIGVLSCQNPQCDML